MERKIYSLLTLIMMLIGFGTADGQVSRLYAGKYAGQGEKGLLVLDVDFARGTIAAISENDAGINPSYFCISRKNSMLYAINEVGRFNGQRSGSVTTLKLDIKKGTAEKITDLAVPTGGPCYVSLSPGEDYLLIANYGSGSVAVVRLDAGGVPSEVSDTIIFRGPEGTRSHPHMIAPGPEGKKIYLTDLGLDRIAIYDLDKASGKLKNTGYAQLAKGAGPRHFAFGKDGSKMYVVNELNSTLTVFDVAKNGNLTEIQTLSALPPEFTGKSYCGDIHVSNDGKFVYGSNRGDNSITTFKISADGRVSVAGFTPCGGEWPRNFVIDPSGKYILVGNQNSNNISVHKIDPVSGIPGPQISNFDTKSPVCLKFITP
ncbi:MAG TPA: lactonase family protein [Bacteroidales bacterium]|nr:beta-propeller fold lactonase family protein [Bacteroidales bacterium]HNR42084.1 lactonase family protein [Bacteroidales bacterium]HPM18731.1 lactonase family protein [Bacteroidales bacterium]HQG77093.1 lactonase family protein [Bacteroidales bacterium]